MYNRNIKYLIILAMVLLSCGTVKATKAEDTSEAKGTSGLPLPRFASLRNAESNLRTGPGMRYPIDWVFVRRGLPMEITAEYDIWRRVRDWEGTEGWVHKNSLTGKRSVIIIGTTRALHREEDIKSPITAHLEATTIGELLSCDMDWCKVKFNRINGFLKKTDFWGAYPNEVFD